MEEGIEKIINGKKRKNERKWEREGESKRGEKAEGGENRGKLGQT